MNIMCPECNGSGVIEYLCPYCNGSGEGPADGTTCLNCDGLGVEYYNCETCNGTGYINNYELIKE